MTCLHNKDLIRDLVNGGPEDERNRLLEHREQLDVFLGTRADDADEKRKDAGEELSHDFACP